MFLNQLLLDFFAVMLFSTVLHIEDMAQMVWKNFPGIAKMVQLPRTFSHEVVTLCSIDP